MSISGGMDKQNVLYPYNGLLIGNKKEWSSDTGYNMDEPWKYYVKWKMSDTKTHILYGSIYMQCPEQATPKQLPRAGGV